MKFVLDDKIRRVKPAARVQAKEASRFRSPWQHRKQEWVRSLALYEPDLIVNTGDNLGHPDAIEAVEYALPDDAT